MNFEANGTSNQQTSEAMNTTEIQQTPLSKVKSPKAYNNPLIDCSLILDAGSKRIKFLLNGYESTIESVYKQVKGDLPSGMAGCFQYKGKNFVVGKGCESVLGELIEAQKDNKIKKLDVWVLGALTSDSDFLDDILEDKRNRYKTKPIRLSINIKLLSLSSNRQGDISKILQGIEGFNYRGRDFTRTYALYKFFILCIRVNTLFQALNNHPLINSDRLESVDKSRFNA
jgi:hypothetical protein